MKQRTLNTSKQKCFGSAHNYVCGRQSNGQRYSEEYCEKEQERDRVRRREADREREIEWDDVAWERDSKERRRYSLSQCTHHYDPCNSLALDNEEYCFRWAFGGRVSISLVLFFFPLFVKRILRRRTLILKITHTLYVGMISVLCNVPQIRAVPSAPALIWLEYCCEIVDVTLFTNVTTQSKRLYVNC